MTLPRDKRLIAALALAGMVLIAALWPRGPSATAGPMVEIREQPLDVTLPFFGSVDALQAETLVSRLRGKSVVLVALAEDGALVQKGDLIARFDASGIEAEIERLLQERNAREAALAATAQLRDWEQDSADALVQSAQFDIAKARGEVERHEGFIAELRQLTDAHASLAGELDVAQRKLNELRDEQVRAEGGLQGKKREAAFKIARAIIDHDKAKADLASVEQQLAQQRQWLAQTELRAPFAGIVVLAEAFRDGAMRKPRVGDSVIESQPIAYLPDLSRLIVRSDVPESALHLLHEGMAARVRVDAYPDLSLAAKLSRIGAMAANDGGNGKRFKVELTLDDAPHALRPGMTARGDIAVDALPAGPTVPLAAVHRDGGQAVVYVPSGQSARREIVLLGRANDQWAQVLRGPPSGTRLLLAPPEP